MDMTTANMVMEQLANAASTLAKWRTYCAHRIRVCEVTGCWIWTGSYRGSSSRVRTRDMRPTVMMDGKRVYAYRLVWALRNGHTFPDGMMALHRCDRPSCVNPDHVRPGTAKDNADDAATRGRTHSRLTDKQVSLIMQTAARLGPSATPSAIAIATGDPLIKRWNVRDVATNGCNIRRVSARTTNAMTASYALGA